MSDIKNIVDVIENSVLVIGPGVITDKDRRKSLAAGFAERYSVSNQSLIKHYFDDDNLIRPKDAKSRMTIQKNFADFYRNKFSESARELYRKIAQIPYSLVISLNPDDTLRNFYDEIPELKEKAVFDFYVKGKKNLKNDTPSKESPYLFNLFGCYTEPESLILTYDDLFEYLRNILPGDGLPPSIRTFLRSAEKITFLGVEFDKWYFQLLVKLLTESDEKYEILRYASPDLSFDANVNCICEKNFEITFVGPDISSFVNELYYHCYKSDPPKLRGEPILTGNEVYNPEIFISYKHNGGSEELAESLYKKGEESGFNIIFDQVNLEFRDRLWEFMKRLGWGKYIIVIISDEYLKSEYCMFEFKEIIRHGQNFDERVFPIVMKDAEVFGENKWNKYDAYWKGEIEKLKDYLKDKDSKSLRSSIESIEKYEEIRESIPQMMEFLGSIVTYNVQEDATFAKMFGAIREQIKNDLEI